MKDVLPLCVITIESGGILRLAKPLNFIIFFERAGFFFPRARAQVWLDTRRAGLSLSFFFSILQSASF